MNDVKKNLGQNENTTVILSFSENKKVRKLGNFSWISSYDLTPRDFSIFIFILLKKWYEMSKFGLVNQWKE